MTSLSELIKAEKEKKKLKITPGVLVDGEIDEISLVDYGANAKFIALIKMLKKGNSMSNSDIISKLKSMGLDPDFSDGNDDLSEKEIHDLISKAVTHEAGEVKQEAAKKNLSVTDHLKNMLIGAASLLQKQSPKVDKEEVNQEMSSQEEKVPAWAENLTKSFKALEEKVDTIQKKASGESSHGDSQSSGDSSGIESKLDTLIKALSGMADAQFAKQEPEQKPEPSALEKKVDELTSVIQKISSHRVGSNSVTQEETKKDKDPELTPEKQKALEEEDLWKGSAFFGVIQDVKKKAGIA